MRFGDISDSGFLALYEDSSNYAKPMKKFISNYMDRLHEGGEVYRTNARAISH